MKTDFNPAETNIPFGRGESHAGIPHYKPGFLPPPAPPIFHAALPQAEYDSVAVTYQQQIGRLQHQINSLQHALTNYMRYFDWLVMFGIDNEFEWHFENDIQPELDRIAKELAELKEYVDSENAAQDTVIQDNYNILNNRITSVRQELLDLINQLESKVDANDVNIKALLETVRADLQSKIDVNSNNIQNNKDNLNAHVTNKNNPHEVTKGQLDLDEVDNTSDANKPISDAAAEKNSQQDTLINAINEKVDSHIANKNNPHEVTAEQLGLAYLEDAMIWGAGETILIDSDEWTLTDNSYVYLVTNTDIRMGDYPFVNPTNQESAIILGNAGLVGTISNDGSITLSCINKPSGTVSVDYFVQRRRG